MSTIYGNPLLLGGKKPTPLSVSTNGTWSIAEGYSPITVNIPASAVTSGTVIVTAEGEYDVTNFKNVMVDIGAVFATTSPVSGVSYVDGLPSDWYIMKEIGMAISEASGSINKNTTGSIYVNKENKWAYKITPGNTINVNDHLYAVMGFNNFALADYANYGGIHSTAGLTFGMVDCIGQYRMNSSDTNSGGWGKCLMRTSTMPTLQSGMPDTLARVKVPYVDYNDQSTIVYYNDYMFLPAEKEVFGTRSYSPEAEANALTQFAYYKNGGSKTKRLSGSAVLWWLRSVYFSDSPYFCLVHTSGDAVVNSASSTSGAAPCFCV